jgi:hypothetical protein
MLLNEDEDGESKFRGKEGFLNTHSESQEAN